MLTISIVIPVYRGEKSLEPLLEEILPLTVEQRTPRGQSFVVREILLVHDCGPDRSDTVIERLAQMHEVVRPVWLSRNFGQHAATLAGIASATGHWIATLDEDGQQDPRDIAVMLDQAIAGNYQVVYAQPTNAPPHGSVRNILSRTAKALGGQLLGSAKVSYFNSFRLIDGEIGRTLAAYCGHGIYLDVGLFWIAGQIGRAPVALRAERGRSTGYSYRKLFAHFWSMVLTTGTRPLRFITLTGLFSVSIAVVLMAYALVEKYYNLVPVEGWTSLLVVIAFFSGCILIALGVIAEYLAMAMGIAMGRPLYVVATKPARLPPDDL